MKKILLFLALLILPITSFATVSSNITKVIVAGDNITTSVPFGTGGYSVPVYLSTDIQVYTQNVANGTITQLTLNTQYTVALTAVTYTASNSVVYYTAVINLAAGSSPYGALPTGTNLILNRVIPYTNLLNITNYSATPATTWNQGYDRATMLAQQLYTLTQQAVLQPVSATTPISIPSANNGYVLCWSGTSLANCANNGTGTPIPIPIPNSDLVAIALGSAVSGTLPTANGGTGSTANSNAANGVPILTGVGYYPALNGSLITNVAAATTATNANLSGNQFGAWVTSNSYGSAYHAATDLEVHAMCGTNAPTCACVTDASSSPSVNRCQFSSQEDYVTCTISVRKGDYWECTSNGSGAYINVLPIGS